MAELAMRKTSPAYFPQSTDYAVEKLRELTDEDDDGPAPNYACQTCGERQHIDEHKRHPPNWCETCESVTRFEPLDE